MPGNQGNKQLQGTKMPEFGALENKQSSRIKDVGSMYAGNLGNKQYARNKGAYREHLETKRARNEGVRSIYAGSVGKKQYARNKGA